MNKYMMIYVIFILIIYPSNLYGYLDPGTLSYLGSLLVSIVVGLFVYAKIIWVKLKEYFIRIFKSPK